MSAVLWFSADFFAGALPFLVWLGRRFAHADVRPIGDGNPGAADAWRAGGWRVGLAVRTAMHSQFLTGTRKVVWKGRRPAADPR